MKRFAAWLGILLLTGCATTAAPPGERHPQDPWEPYNRAIFEFNRDVDRIVLRPVARGYAKVTPAPVQEGVGNFFTNLGYPVDIVNLLLQGKPADSAKATGRFVLNSTVGLLGIFDVASRAGIPQYDEDFGQTFGVWGWEQSRYFVVPFFGGTTIRDALGYVPDAYTNVGWKQIEDEELFYSLVALDLVHLRSTVISQEKTIQEAFDKYKLFRDSYLQRRTYLIHDGENELPEYERMLQDVGQP